MSWNFGTEIEKGYEEDRADGFCRTHGWSCLRLCSAWKEMDAEAEKETGLKTRRNYYEKCPKERQTNLLWVREFFNL